MALTDILQISGVAALCLMLPAPCRADTLSPEWTVKKCGLYQSAVKDALQIQGGDGVSESFLGQNTAFIAGGCTGHKTLCPVTDQDRSLANLLTVLTMNEGMASTFLPLGCPPGFPKPQP